MNKSFLAAIILGCTLSACSSEPSDLRPGAKVSLDQVPPGSRDTDIYNLDGANPDATKEAHEAHGAAGHGSQHGDATEMHDRKDVMPNHDEHKNDIGGEDAVPATDKTTDASKVENHE
jgi:hypothetical protein